MLSVSRGQRAMVTPSPRTAPHVTGSSSAQALLEAWVSLTGEETGQGHTF